MADDQTQPADAEPVAAGSASDADTSTAEGSSASRLRWWRRRRESRLNRDGGGTGEPRWPNQLAAIAAAVGLILTAWVGWVGVQASREQIKQSDLALEQNERQQANMVTVWSSPRNRTDLFVANRSLDPVGRSYMTVYPVRATKQGDETGLRKQVDITFDGLAPCTQYKITLSDVVKTAPLGPQASKGNALSLQVLAFSDASGHSWARDFAFKLSDRQGKRSEFDFDTGSPETTVRIDWIQLAQNGAESKTIDACGPNS